MSPLTHLVRSFGSPHAVGNARREVERHASEQAAVDALLCRLPSPEREAQRSA